MKDDMHLSLATAFIQPGGVSAKIIDGRFYVPSEQVRTQYVRTNLHAGFFEQLSPEHKARVMEYEQACAVNTLIEGLIKDEVFSFEWFKESASGVFMRWL